MCGVCKEICKVRPSKVYKLSSIPATIMASQQEPMSDPNAVLKQTGEVAAEPVINATVHEEKAGHADEGSLQKLLKHMEGLQSQNAEFVEILEQIASTKSKELDEICTQDLLPWIQQLNLPEELQQQVLDGIKKACMQPRDQKNWKKATLHPLKENPVLQVMCAAAAAHGQAIREVEATRQELKQASATAEQMHTVTRDKSVNDHDAVNRILGRQSNDTALGKRTAQEISQTPEQIDSVCWSDLFNSF